jgi:H+-translocating NAD(P) transhydrogenase subunit beta
VSAAVQVVALVSIGLFVVGLKRLARVRTARQGNLLIAGGMLVAVLLALVESGRLAPLDIAVGLAVGTAVGLVIVARASATSMPQVVARFNGFGGAASALVALALFWQVVVNDGAAGGSGWQALGGTSATTLALSVVIGAVTLSGSVVAELKLWGRLRSLGAIPGRTLVLAGLLVASVAAAVVALAAIAPATGAAAIVLLSLLALIAGVVSVGPVGGADMPVMISLLNSLSGLAAAATGFALGHTLLIVAGTIVGAAGLMLTRIMCAAMNRTLLNVLAGGMGTAAGVAGDAEEYEGVVSTDPEEVAMLLEVARSVVIVPGYGLAAARAQHAAADLAATLVARGVEVRFAIHPVAGRMPGHMNVVLAEADVPYEQLVEMDGINRDFASTDVAIVVGANDVTNPAARTRPDSPIAGMPILDVASAARVVVIKRSLAPGYSGIKNELFEQDNTALLFGDAKEALDLLVQELSTAAGVRG